MNGHYLALGLAALLTLPAFAEGKEKPKQYASSAAKLTLDGRIVAQGQSMPVPQPRPYTSSAGVQEETVLPERGFVGVQPITINQPATYRPSVPNSQPSTSVSQPFVSVFQTTFNETRESLNRDGWDEVGFIQQGGVYLLTSNRDHGRRTNIVSALSTNPTYLLIRSYKGPLGRGIITDLFRTLDSECGWLDSELKASTGGRCMITDLDYEVVIDESESVSDRSKITVFSRKIEKR